MPARAAACRTGIINIDVCGWTWETAPGELFGKHLLDRGDEAGGAVDIALGVGRRRRYGFVIALLAGLLGLLSEGVEMLVEGAGGDEALMEEVPGTAMSARILVALREGRRAA
jgi:hypothetical protein